MTGVLDRYMAARMASATALATVAMLGVFLGIEVLASMSGMLQAGDIAGRTGMMVERFLWRLPALANIALPTAAVAAAIAVCAPMLRRGEFIALNGGGVSPGRATRSLLAVALLVGMLDAGLADWVTPMATARALAIDDALQRQQRQGRVWSAPDTRASWFCGRARLIGVGEPALDGVVVASRERMAIVDSVVWRGGAWTASGGAVVARRAPGGGLEVDRAAALRLEGDLALNQDPAQLYRMLLPRFTMSGPQLLDRGERSDLALVASRWSRALLPLLCLLLALPVFVRFAHRDQLVVGVLRACLAAAVPGVMVVAAGLAADNVPGHPAFAVAAGCLLAAVPGTLAWRNWRL